MPWHCPCSPEVLKLKICSSKLGRFFCVHPWLCQVTSSWRRGEWNRTILGRIWLSWIVKNDYFQTLPRSSFPKLSLGLSHGFFFEIKYFFPSFFSVTRGSLIILFNMIFLRYRIIYCILIQINVIFFLYLIIKNLFLGIKSANTKKILWFFSSLPLKKCPGTVLAVQRS